jgi:hypothetical protein
LKTIGKTKPGDKDAGEINLLKENILLAKAPWVNLTESYMTDDQPMQSLNTRIQAGAFFHPLSLLHINLETPVFQRKGSTSTALWFIAGNKSVVGMAGLSIDASVGIIRFPTGNAVNWTGNLIVEKKISRNLSFTVKSERMPYFYTLRSIDSTILENRYSASLKWDKSRSWTGEAAFEYHRFPLDKNNIYTVYGWIFSPPLRLSVFDFRLGYSFNHSTSDSMNYKPESKVKDIMTSSDAVSGITGIYDPYFTPRDQVSHSVMLGISIQPSGVVDLSVNARYGVLGSTMVPYFYLYKDPVNPVLIRYTRGLVKQDYHPIRADALVNIHLSKTINFRAFYTYQKTYYYTGHSGGIGLGIILWNGKRGK